MPSCWNHTWLDLEYSMEKLKDSNFHSLPGRFLKNPRWKNENISIKEFTFRGSNVYWGWKVYQMDVTFVHSYTLKFLISSMEEKHL